MIEIIPAIMPESYADLSEKAGMAYRYAKTLHLDVMDGSMTHSVNWPFTEGGADELKKITTGELSLPYWKDVDYEVDVMMENPEDSFADWVNLGFHRIIVHFENTKQLSSIIREWKGVVELGVAVGVETPNEEIYPFIDRGLDFVQFMGIYQIGFQGNPFDSRVLEKVKNARSAYPNLPISVDGSVNLETAEKIIAAGANRLVVGSALFRKESTIEESFPEIISFDIGENVDISEKKVTKKRDIKAAIEEFKKLIPGSHV